jgi:hypothetical protein
VLRRGCTYCRIHCFATSQSFNRIERIKISECVFYPYSTSETHTPETRLTQKNRTVSCDDEINGGFNGRSNPGFCQLLRQILCGSRLSTALIGNEAKPSSQTNKILSGKVFTVLNKQLGKYCPQSFVQYT